MKSGARNDQFQPSVAKTVVLNAIETAQCVPREIRVGQHQLKTFLEPMAAELGIALRKVNRLSALEEAREQLLNMMGDPGPFMT